jgi:CyaY protein
VRGLGDLREVIDMPLDEQDFQDHAEKALDELDAAYSRIGARYPVEADLAGGVLRVTFEEPDQAVFVVSPNGPARQIWVSALMKSFKFDWDEEREKFVHAETREPLREVLERLSREQLGDDGLKL